jgi:hypothetical protein
VNRTVVAVGVVVGVLVLGGGALAMGVGPAPGGGSGDDVGSFPTATPGDGGVEPAADGDRDPLGPQFRFRITSVESCGQTCREVTGSLRNGADEPAENVTVYSRIFVGNSTAEDDVVWSGRERVGRLGAGATHASTRTVELSYQEALAVQQADGVVTVQTTVRSANDTVTFTEQRTVA